MTPLNLSKKNKLKYVLSTGIGIGVLVLFGFVGNALYPIIHGPLIKLENLRDGGVITESTISLVGIAKYTQNLIINGNILKMDPSGEFQEKIVLNPGYNIITLQATDRFGKTNNEMYRLVLQEDDPAPALTLHQE